MDPVSLIVAAVVAGAAAGLQEQAAQTVKEAYGALKRLLAGKHNVDLAVVERKPGSGAKQASLKEDLADTEAATDPAVIEAAKKLVEEVRRNDAAAAKSVGVDLDEVSAEFIRIINVKVVGPAIGVDVDRVTARGGIVIEGVDVDSGGGSNPP